MYEIAKKIVKSLVPKPLFKAGEHAMRKALLLFYKGNHHTCNICNTQLKTFIQLKNGERICPACGSMARNRRVLQIVQNIEATLPNGNILEFSPNKGLKNKFKSIFGKLYVTTDYVGEFDADKKLDITNIQEPDNAYSLIICFHVLEHILYDGAAMKELYRILKPGGKALIQTPFKEGDIYENPDVTTPEGRLEHFGQDDHVRIYSINGLINRLEKVGFHITKVTPESFDKEENRFWGMLENDTVLIAGKG